MTVMVADRADLVHGRGMASGGVKQDSAAVTRLMQGRALPLPGSATTDMPASSAAPNMPPPTANPPDGGS